MNSHSTIRAHELKAGLYRIDPERSKVDYAGKHMFGLGTVHAQFKVTSGEIHIAELLPDSSIQANLDAASFTSANAKRDKDVKSAGLLDVATYPDIQFASTAVHQDGDGLIIDGTVTAHGASVPVQVTVTSIETDSDLVRVRARASHLDRYAFGITGSKGMVGRFLDLELDVVALRG